MVDPKTTLSPGDFVDNFKVLRPIGRGGMGEVYLARDSQLGRKVAIKVLRPQALGDQDAQQRFLFEAKVTARFNHPHIVTIYAVGKHGSCPYVVLEYLEGHTLRQKIIDQELVPSDNVRIVLAMAEALEEAHRHKILHRDLKPENVYLSRNGQVRVMDFGLAKTFYTQEDQTRGTLSLGGDSLIKEHLDTTDGGLVGTPNYMAPEQWLGHELTMATDIWALGVCIYELLKGQLPFKASTIYKLCAMVGSPEPSPELEPTAGISEEFVELVARCMAKDSNIRPSIGEVVQTLRKMTHHGRSAQVELDQPFRGLLSFTEQQADLFFGRDEEINVFLERLRSEAVLPVVGPSGAGKSSFIQAGVIPRLREQGRWIVIGLRPKTRPFKALVSRLTRGDSVSDSSRRSTKSHRFYDLNGKELLEKDLLQKLQESPDWLGIFLQQMAEENNSNVLLFVDQFEELFTLVQDRKDRLAFLEAICSAADDPNTPVRVVFTVREDFLGKLAESELVRMALSRVTILRQPSTEALHQILERPVELMGYQYEDNTLVEDIIGSVSQEVSSLTLVQVTCDQLWAGRDQNKKRLLRAVYEEIGGVEGALAHHADSVLRGLSNKQLDLARKIFLRLVTPEGTRRVVTREQLIEGLGNEAVGVLDRLLSERSLTVRRGPDGGSAEVELVHESLIERWNRLKRWIDENREELVFLSEVSQAAELWEKRGRRAAEVWEGQAFQEAQKAEQRCTSEIPSIVRQFLDAGAKKKKRRIWRRWILVAASMITLALVAIVFANKEREARRGWQSAERQKKLARQSEKTTRQTLAAALAEKALFAKASTEALLLAAASLREAESPDARGVLATLAKHPRPCLRWQSRPGVYCSDLRFSPQQVALACINNDYIYNEGKIVVWDPKEGVEITRIISSEGSRYKALAWSKVNSLIATGDSNGLVQILEFPSQKMRWSQKHKAVDLIDLDFSSDGDLLVAAFSKTPLVVWDWKANKTIARLADHCSQINDVAFAPGSNRLLGIGCKDGSVLLWDTASSHRTTRLAGHQTEVTRLAFFSKGRRLASADVEGTVLLWDLSSRADIRRIETGQKPVTDIEISSDGYTLIVSGGPAKVALWDTRSSRLLSELGGLSEAVEQVSLSASGRILASSDKDSVRLWDTKTLREIARLDGPLMIRNIAYTADGRHLLSACGSLRIWNAATGEQLAKLSKPGTNVDAVAVSPVDNLIATTQVILPRTGLKKATLSLWDFETRRLTHSTQDIFDNPGLLEFSSDGKHVAVASKNSVTVFDVAKKKIKQTFVSPLGWTRPVAISPDNRFVALAGRAEEIYMWDQTTSQVAQVFRGHGSVLSLTFSPKGLLLASGSYGRTIRLWDTKTAEVFLELSGHHDQVQSLSFSPDGNLLASASWDHTVRIWDLDTKQEQTLLPHGRWVDSVSFSPDGRFIASAGTGGSIRVWDLACNHFPVVLQGLKSDALFLAYSGDGKNLVSIDKNRWMLRWSLEGDPNPQRFMLPKEKLFALSSDGRFALLGNPGNELCIWNLESQKMLSCMPKASAKFAALSHDAKHLLVIDSSHKTYLWSPPSQKRKMLSKQRKWCHAASFSPDDRKIAVLCTGSGTGIFETKSGKILMELGHNQVFDRHFSLAFSTRGDLLALGGTNHIQVWDVTTGEMKDVLVGHQKEIGYLVFSPDDRFLASRSRDNTTRIWDLKTFKEIARFLLTTYRSAGLAFSPNGRTLALLDNKKIRLLDLSVLDETVDSIYERLRFETGLIVDGVEVVPDSKRLSTRFVLH